MIDVSKRIHSTIILTIPSNINQHSQINHKCWTETFYAHSDLVENYIDDLGISKFRYWCYELQPDTDHIMTDFENDPNDSKIGDLFQDNCHH